MWSYDRDVCIRERAENVFIRFSSSYSFSARRFSADVNWYSFRSDKSDSCVNGIFVIDWEYSLQVVINIWSSVISSIFVNKSGAGSSSSV